MPDISVRKFNKVEVGSRPMLVYFLEFVLGESIRGVGCLGTVYQLRPYGTQKPRTTETVKESEMLCLPYSLSSKL